MSAPMNAAYVRHALVTAIRIARFEKDAIREFDQSIEGFFRSFFGIVLCAPLFVLLLVAERRIAANAAVEMPDLPVAALPPLGLAFYTIESLNYLANWIVFPVAMILFVRLLRASHRYIPFIVAYNWTACIALAANIVPYVLYLAGVLALPAAYYFYFPVWLYILVYRWRVARDGLQISGLNATGIVMIDFLLSLFIVYADAYFRGMLVAP